MCQTDLLTASQFSLEVGKSFSHAVTAYRGTGNKLENFAQLLGWCTNPTCCYSDLAQEMGKG